MRYNFSQPMKDNVEEAVSGVRGKVVLKVFGTDLARMRTTLQQAKEVLKAVPGIVDLDLYRDVTTPQLQVRFDRQALARAGVSMEDAQRTLETALAGRVATTTWEGERPVPVRLILPPAVRDDVEKIGAVTVATESGARVALRDLAEIRVAEGLASINREGNARYLALKFNVEGRDMGSVVNDAIATVTEHVHPPEGQYFVWGGEFENQQRAIARLKLVVPMAVLAVLGLLYAAMNSGRSALAILLTVPFALTGGAFALLLDGVPLSVSARDRLHRAARAGLAHGPAGAERRGGAAAEGRSAAAGARRRRRRTRAGGADGLAPRVRRAAADGGRLGRRQRDAAPLRAGGGRRHGDDAA